MVNELKKEIPIQSREIYAEFEDVEGEPHLKMGLTLQDIPDSVEISVRGSSLIHKFHYSDSQGYESHIPDDMPYLTLYLGTVDGILIGFEIDFAKMPGGETKKVTLAFEDKETYEAVRSELDKLAAEARGKQNVLKSMNFTAIGRILEDHIMATANG